MPLSRLSIALVVTVCLAGPAAAETADGARKSRELLRGRIELIVAVQADRAVAAAPVAAERRLPMISRGSGYDAVLRWRPAGSESLVAPYVYPAPSKVTYETVQ